MNVPSWTILAGLGALHRREVADLLANFEATTLWTISKDIFLIPYGNELPSGDDNFHICLYPNEYHVNCFFAPSQGAGAR